MILSSQHSTTRHLTLPLSAWNFDGKQHDCRPHPPYFFLFSGLKIKKLKDHHLDTVEVIEAESQVVLNIPSEHDFQDALKKIPEVLGMVHTHGRGLLRVLS
jgi:hypothetical protein